MALESGTGASRGHSPREHPGKPSGERSSLQKLDALDGVSFQLADALARHGISDCLVLRKLFDGTHEEAEKIVSELGCGSEVADELVMCWEASTFPAFTRLQLMANFDTLEASVSRVKEDRECKRRRLQLQVIASAVAVSATSVSAQLPMHK